MHNKKIKNKSVLVPVISPPISLKPSKIRFSTYSVEYSSIYDSLEYLDFITHTYPITGFQNLLHVI